MSRSSNEIATWSRADAPGRLAARSPKTYAMPQDAFFGVEDSAGSGYGPRLQINAEVDA
jgi:hypothetical protein